MKKQTTTTQQNQVRKHYNARPQYTPQTRQQTKIFQLRNFNNWLKSVLISLHVRRGDIVFDLCCGKGGDLKKYQHANIQSYYGADIADGSVVQASERYNAMNHPKFPCSFDATFIAVNCFTVDLSSTSTFQNVLFDCVSCQFSLHYSFESREYADMLLKNASDRLKDGGKFFVTCTDSRVLLKKLSEKSSDCLEIGNSVYKAKFKKRDINLAEEPFGQEYTFLLEDAIDNCPEYLVGVETLTDLAKSHNLELEETLNFHEFYEVYSKHPNMKKLTEVAYKIKKELISADEWEAIQLYRVFVFKRVNGQPKLPQVNRPQRRFQQVTESEIIHLV